MIYSYKFVRDIEKAIEYNKIASNKDNHFALYYLGDISSRKQEIKFIITLVLLTLVTPNHDLHWQI